MVNQAFTRSRASTECLGNAINISIGGTGADGPRAAIRSRAAPAEEQRISRRGARVAVVSGLRHELPQAVCEHARCRLASGAPQSAIANYEVLYAAPSGVNVQLALTDLNGVSRPVSYPFELGREVSLEVAFNGRSVTWSAGCVYGGTVPARAPTAPPSPACEAVQICCSRLSGATRRRSSRGAPGGVECHPLGGSLGRRPTGLRRGGLSGQRGRHAWSCSGDFCAY